jgi:hypothetical protein
MAGAEHQRGHEIRPPPGPMTSAENPGGFSRYATAVSSYFRYWTF